MLSSCPGRRGGGGGVLLGILRVGVPSVLQILSQFQTKNVIFHTRFQTRLSIPVLRPDLWAEIMKSLLRLERKQKHYSIPLRIRIFFFLSYSFGIEAINRFRHSVVSSKTISDSRPKCMGQEYVRFQTKTALKNPTRWGGTYLNGLYLQGSAPPPPPGFMRLTFLVMKACNSSKSIINTKFIIYR